MAESSSNPAFIVQGCCEPPSHLYAEYLPKLQKISIVVSLAIPSDSKTKVIIGKDANTLEVHHKTVTTRMALPVNSSIQEVHLGFANRGISPGQTKLTWRIEPANAVIKAAEAAARTGIEVMRVPWSAADLVTNVDVVCRKCEAVILGKDSLVEWRDLPSENWAEMMEFWHCHKPTTTNHDKKEKNLTNGHTNESIGSRKHSTTSNDELASRGYGANSAISARSGIGFVDLTKFLFFGKDCCGLTMTALSEDKGDQQTAIHTGSMTTCCVQCRTQVGQFEPQKNGFSLYKWAVDLLNGSLDTKPRHPPPSLAQCLAAALLEIQARDNSAMIILQGAEKEALTIWVLNPHIVFSCNAVQKAKAIKVLFQTKAVDEAVGELELPDAVVKELREVLQRSTDFLPPGERTTQRPRQEGVWNVGFLQRL